MPTLAALALAAAAAPLLLGFLGPRLAGLPAPAARRWASAGAGASLVLAVASAVGLALGGPVSATLAGAGGPVGLGVRVDGLTVVMLLTVTLIGTVVCRFAARSLDGDPGQARFCAWLSWTLAAVLFLVVSGNLVQLFAAWVATSHGLHQLLTFYAERPAARLAARKKFLISRLGDAFLLVAFVLLYRIFGTTEFDVLFERAHELASPARASQAGWIGALLVLGAMTKSAQFPFHTWLPDTMETPTPVSALMHAGIINAGGFLLIRMSPLLSAAPTALWLLAAGGALTAVFAAAVMLTQTDVKRKLAWSTISQMGFMMLQCGLGAFAVATLHLVGHSLYKGHAFLAAASTVDPREPQPRAHPSHAVPVRAAVVAAALGAGVAVVGAVAWTLGVDAAAKPGLPVLAAILALAVAQLLVTERQTGRGSARRLGAALRDGAAIATAYFLLAGAFEWILAGAVAALPWTPGAGSIGLGVLVTLLFGGAFALQTRLPGLAASAAGRRLYVHASNGFYLGALQNRLVQRVWPLRPA